MRVYGWSDGKGGVFHYRIAEPLRGLSLLGHETATGQTLTIDSVKDYDVILVRALHDETSSIAWRHLAQLGQHTLVYDLDDDIWNWDKSTDAFHYWNRRRLLQAQDNIKLAHLVTTPSKLFASYLKQLNKNVVVLPNTVPQYLLNLSRPFGARPPFVIGWQGAIQHIEDLKLIYKPVLRFLKDNPGSELWLWGPKEFRDLPYFLEDRVKCYPWQPNLKDYYMSLNMDVGLAPLKLTAFNETKSAVKVQEYSALGIPAIASNSSAYHGFLNHGYNGYFARGEDSWYDTLAYLRRSRRMRQIMGLEARMTARQWTTEACSHKWERAYMEAMLQHVQTVRQ